MAKFFSPISNKNLIHIKGNTIINIFWKILQKTKFFS